MTVESRFIRACRSEPRDTIPVWFMRQAGRYQPSYRKLREGYRMLDIARDPKLITEVTVRPVDELGVDAAILFSDIMIPLAPMGVDFDIKENVGPIVAHPVRSHRDVAVLSRIEPARDLDFVLEGVQRIVSRLDPVPLIGFAGGPFTLASYMIEGSPSRDYRHTKEMMWTMPEVWDLLMEKLSDMVSRYLAAQVKAGARAIQVFDSWIGALSYDDYQRRILPYMSRIFASLASLDVPTIYFGVGTAHLLSLMKSAGPSVLGVDWRVDLGHVRAEVGHDVALQGNLDPMVLLSGWPQVEVAARRVIEPIQGETGYIFNLGHGVPKETDPALLRKLVDRVHAWGRGGDGR